MDADSSASLRAELLNDFYLESDEHLGNIRQQLALIEGSLGGSSSEATIASALQSLFRSFHSFKGICAMVGLPSAEQTAHGAEDFLRHLTKQHLGLTASGIEMLMTVAQRLEQLVSAHRLRQSLPDMSDVLRELEASNTRHSQGGRAENNSGPINAVAGVAPTRPDPIESLQERGLSAWRCTFEPSRERDQRGVNVNSVRGRIGAIGEIVSATPLVSGGGSIRFEFLVGMKHPPEDLAAWNTDGVSLVPVEESGPSVAVENKAAAASERSSSLFVAPSHMVRVDLSRLDELMRITGEMVIHRSRLEDRIDRLNGDNSALKEVSQALSRSLRQLRSAITHVRMVPVAEIFTRMPFVVRDLARETGHKVKLVLEGAETEIDKYLVERLKEPLLHLVRNAITHGAESSEERAAAGKPAETTLLLRAVAAGSLVHIHVRDDGRGIDAMQIARRAAELGIQVKEPLDQTDILRILCMPGFSTREEADRGAGRGVGMAVVNTAMRELGGSLSFETTAGRGTHFVLRVPLTLSIAETVVVSAGDQTCAVPQGFIDEIIQITEKDVRQIKQAEVISYRDGLLPLFRLRTMFGAGASTRPELPVLVLTSERGSTGLVVDRVQAQREIVVRPMQDPLLQVRGVFGATELGDGRPVLILDPVAITNNVVRPPSAGPPFAN